MTDVTNRPAYPQWPSKMSRSDRAEARARKKAFESALRINAKKFGWGYARQTLFRDDDGWFRSNSPHLAYQRGVFVEWAQKPMSLDPLFWLIAGLEENAKLPLSFRATGAWTLQPPRKFEYICGDEASPIRLAGAALEWSESRRSTESNNATIAKMISELGPLDSLQGRNRSLAVCLLILINDFDKASALCRNDNLLAHAFGKNSGGFISTMADGNSITFIDQARAWLLRRKNGVS